MHPLPTALLLGWLCSALAADPASPIPAALRQGPPLPGEPLDGWPGLLPTPAVRTEALDLGAVLAQASATSPRLAEARARTEAAELAAQAAGRPSNPSLELELEPEEEGPRLEATLELSLSNLVFAPLRAAAARPLATATGLRGAEEQARFRLEVSSAWYGLVAAEQRLRLAQQSLDTLAAAVEVAEARQVSGSATRLERSAHRAAFESARGEVAVLELERRRAASALQQITGLSPEILAGPLALDFPELPPQPPLPPQLGAEAARRSLGLAAGREQSQALLRQASLLRIERRSPDLSLGLRNGWSLGAPADEQAPGELAVIAHLSLPLLDRGTRGAASLDAGAAAEQARTAALSDEVHAVAQHLSHRLWTAHARMQHEEQITQPAWAEVSHETLRAYNAMQVGVYELLAARRQELLAALTLVDARHAYWTASVELDALLAGALPEAAPAADTRTPGSTAAPSGGH